MKYLKSGEVNMGEAGQLTKLFDCNGVQLYTGDVVAVSKYQNFYNAFIFEDFLTVVENSDIYGHDKDNTKFFVMGLASCHYAYKDGEAASPEDPDADFHVTTVYQENEEWQLKLVKRWDQTVHNEINGGIRVVVEE